MKNKASLKKIGKNIQLARLKKGFTQEDVANNCGINPKQVSAIECGISFGSVPLIVDICNFLEVSPNYIFNETVGNYDDKISIIPEEMYKNYLKLNEENKKFVQDAVNHLYNMQKKRAK